MFFISLWKVAGAPWGPKGITMMCYWLEDPSQCTECLCTQYKEIPRSYNAPLECHMCDDESLKMESMDNADLMRKYHGMQQPVLHVYNTLYRKVNLFLDAV